MKKHNDSEVFSDDYMQKTINIKHTLLKQLSFTVEENKFIMTQLQKSNDALQIMVKGLKQSKEKDADMIRGLEESKERLFINILDPAYISVEKAYPKSFLIVLISTFIGYIITSLCIILYKNIKNSINDI